MLVERDRIEKIDREAEIVSVPLTAKYIGQFACFYGALTSLNIEDTQIIIIGKYAFSHCYELEEVRFPTSLEEICEGAFKECKELTNIIFPNDSKLRIIGPRAFENCDCLKKLYIPPSLEKIGDYAFFYCEYVSKDVIELQDTNIRELGLDSFGNDDTCIILPRTVDAKSFIANSGCQIDVVDDHPFIKQDGCGYYIAHRTILKCTSQRRHILIRRGVETIVDNCFFVSKIVSITIPASVIEIGECAFTGCEKLKWVHFAKDSRLKELKKKAFSQCNSLKQIRFPKSLKIIRNSFYCCERLQKVVFPQDSRLERIENAFEFTRIKHLYLPQSVKEIDSVHIDIYRLKSIHINSEFFSSNRKGTIITSKDGSELVCVLHMNNGFDIPEGIRVLKKGCLGCLKIADRLVIPASVEVIEDRAFSSNLRLDVIEFAEGSRLKSLGFKSLPITRCLTLNNENFVQMENGVVMSVNPRGIVFVPRSLTELEIEPGVEIIYSYAFYQSKIMVLNFPKSLKKISRGAFEDSKLVRVTFEEGTELDFICKNSFKGINFATLNFPLVKGKISRSAELKCNEIELPPNFTPSPENRSLLNSSYFKKIVCPKSSIESVVDIDILPEDFELIDC